MFSRAISAIPPSSRARPASASGRLYLIGSRGFRLRYGPPKGRRAAKDKIALAVGAAINRNKMAKHFGREPPNKTDYDVLSSDLTQHGWMQADMQPFSSVATRRPPVGGPARKRQTVTSNSPPKARTSLTLVD